MERTSTPSGEVIYTVTFTEKERQAIETQNDALYAGKLHYVHASPIARLLATVIWGYSP